MKVKFIKYHVMFAHDVNDVCELTDSDAKELIESGYAVDASKLSAKELKSPELVDPIEPNTLEEVVENMEDSNSSILKEAVEESKTKPAKQPKK